MEKLLGYEELPQAVSRQIGQVVDIWKRQLGEELVGVYLHGSIALNAFCPKSGDIDILVVVRSSPDIVTKLAVAEELLKIDQKPCPLEMSAILLRDAREWRTPGNCVFHYSDLWAAKLRNKLKDRDAECYVVDREFPDADVTSYIRLIRESGIVLSGEKIEDVFCDISDEDFWAAISADIGDYDFHDYAPQYLASNILILGRILSFKSERRILSKYEGGLWMIDHVPEELRYLPRLAMRMWFEDGQYELPEDDLEKLKAYLVGEIQKEM